MCKPITSFLAAIILFHLMPLPLYACTPLPLEDPFSANLKIAEADLPAGITLTEKTPSGYHIHNHTGQDVQILSEYDEQYILVKSIPESITVGIFEIYAGAQPITKIEWRTNDYTSVTTNGLPASQYRAINLKIGEKNFSVPVEIYYTENERATPENREAHERSLRNGCGIPGDAILLGLLYFGGLAVLGIVGLTVGVLLILRWYRR